MTRKNDRKHTHQGEADGSTSPGMVLVMVWRQTLVQAQPAWTISVWNLKSKDHTVTYFPPFPMISTWLRPKKKKKKEFKEKTAHTSVFILIGTRWLMLTHSHHFLSRHSLHSCELGWLVPRVYTALPGRAAFCSWQRDPRPHMSPQGKSFIWENWELKSNMHESHMYLNFKHTVKFCNVSQSSCRKPCSFPVTSGKGEEWGSVLLFMEVVFTFPWSCSFQSMFSSASLPLIQ